MQSLRQKSGLQVGGQLGHRGSTLLQVQQPDLVEIHSVNVCQYCHLSLTNIEPIRFNKRQIFEIENGKLIIIEHQAEVKLCSLCRKISKGYFPDNLKATVQYGSSVFSRIVYLNQYQLLPVARVWRKCFSATRDFRDRLLIKFSDNGNSCNLFYVLFVRRKTVNSRRFADYG